MFVTKKQYQKQLEQDAAVFDALDKKYDSLLQDRSKALDEVIDGMEKRIDFLEKQLGYNNGKEKSPYECFYDSWNISTFYNNSIAITSKEKLTLVEKFNALLKHLGLEYKEETKETKGFHHVKETKKK